MVYIKDVPPRQFFFGWYSFLANVLWLVAVCLVIVEVMKVDDDYGQHEPRSLANELSLRYTIVG